MGFCYLTGFNVAMFGKIGWKLTENPGTIVSKVFKTKYYPHGELLEADLCRQCLSTRMRLQTRAITCPVTCPFSQLIWKMNGIFLCMGCGLSMEVWQEVGLWRVIAPLVSSSNGFVELFWAVCDGLDDKQKGLFAMVLWGLWKSRNDKVWENKETSSKEVVFGAKSILFEWLQMTQQNHEHHLSPDN